MKRGAARRRVNVGLGVAVAALALPACAISTDPTPRDVASQELTPAVGPDAEPIRAEGTVRVYLESVDDLGTGRVRLRAVNRDVTESADAVIAALLAGPSRQEVNDQLRSAIPVDVQVRSITTNGTTLLIDLSSEFADLAGANLVTAVAQIVLTATELNNVDEVLLLVEGEDPQWPNAAGVLRPGALTRFDYIELLDWAQPAYPAVPSGTP
jgi:spore germination protein GerM